MNGGYVMVDCKGMNLLAESAQTISGINKAVEVAYNTGKPIVVSNVIYGEGVNCSPISVMVTPYSDGAFIATTHTLQIYVNADDSVEVVNMIPDSKVTAKTAKK